MIAFAIDDLRAEIGQVDEVLGRLLIAAVATGLEWKRPLAEVSEIANPGMGGGGGCMREYLSGFESSGHFRGELAPLLREAARPTASSRTSA
jgi:hypothetical protein